MNATLVQSSNIVEVFVTLKQIFKCLFRAKDTSLQCGLLYHCWKPCLPTYRQISCWRAIKYFALVSDDVSHLWQLYHYILLLFSYIQSNLTFLIFIGSPQLQPRSFVHHLTVTFRNEPPQIKDTISIYQLHSPLSLSTSFSFLPFEPVLPIRPLTQDLSPVTIPVITHDP